MDILMNGRFRDFDRYVFSVLKFSIQELGVPICVTIRPFLPRL